MKGTECGSTAPREEAYGLQFASKVSAFFLNCMQTGKKQLQMWKASATTTHVMKNEKEYGAFEQLKNGHKENITN